MAPCCLAGENSQSLYSASEVQETMSGPEPGASQLGASSNESVILAYSPNKLF